MQDIKM